jgi:hypothetical protein
MPERMGYNFERLYTLWARKRICVTPPNTSSMKCRKRSTVTDMRHSVDQVNTELAYVDGRHSAVILFSKEQFVRNWVKGVSEVKGDGVRLTLRIMAVPWLRRLVAGLSPRRPGFDSGSVHIGFVVDRVALGQVFLRVLRFPLSISTHR